MHRALGVAASLLLGGCAGPTLKSTLVAGPSAPDWVGAQAAVVSVSAAEQQATALQADLVQRLSSAAGVPVQVGRTPEAFVRVRLGADEAFEAGTAQLQPRALLVCAEIASALGAAPASVVHVLVHSADPEAEPATALTARRAASVQSYLLARGLPAARLRAEGRGGREPLSPDVADAANGRIELVIKPVLAGAEAQAWIPPPLALCSGCKASP